jgi:hypothetical protein
VDLKVSLAPEKIAALEAESAPAIPGGGKRRKLDLHI